ncbi:MAG TPA: hypothetical protein PLJ27_11335 [Polyangiaceae bacterium]|jgi:hypothetical protein|nr:MAG: hypothetical protein BWY17_04058 [Deltaproteobacteria bacterium ADurb.Bin207]HNS95912.1 hypothetical protein [Polyangiaceae bacterium]HNZ24526.1 hypothetical protein [Polyangiaceae bacterium]HOD21988.1 hypothetical protein [Polyangiaceae bacterium]HOE47954.1 hypothetical protein [Polyangiaceae bacterium]
MHCVFATVLAFSIVCAPIHAQTPSRTHREAAIALGEEGLALLDQGEYAAALRKFDAADELIPAPTFGVRAAMCLEKMGHWVEAIHRYEQVVAIRVDPSWPEIHVKAQQEARVRAEALRHRVARLEVSVVGPPDAQYSLKLDAAPVDLDSTSTVLLNPGEHVLELIHGTTSDLRRFQVAEAEHRTERFTLRPPTDFPPSSSSLHGTVGWVSIALGVTGVLVGSVTGYVAYEKKNDLEVRCPKRICPPTAWEDNQSYDRWRTASTAGFVGGTIALGLGTLLLLTEPSTEPAPTATGRFSLKPWFGATTAGFGGEF